ncbi:Rv0909 family putative TA system antitoxin [Streptomyces griseoaurantiacus]|uniref:Rv0909 family putative TA system antitoxin n=1 Tax=Streptomyces griseoaurantiacus TaxID=68213 RepID=UPI0030E205EF
MGIFDRLKSAAQSGTGRKMSEKMSDQAERRVNDKTGGKHADQVDQAQQQMEDRLGMKRDEP